MNKRQNDFGKMLKDLSPMILLETCLIALICLGGFVLHLLGLIDFSIKIFNGALLGAAVMLLNYALLTASVDKAIKNYMALRGDKEMTDEEAERFAAENSMPIQNAIKTSYIIRTASMVVTLLVAFLTGWFNAVATAIPLLAFRPMLALTESARAKAQPIDQSKLIKYDEKESDD